MSPGREQPADGGSGWSSPDDYRIHRTRLRHDADSLPDLKSPFAAHAGPRRRSVALNQGCATWTVYDSDKPSEMLPESYTRTQ